MNKEQEKQEKQEEREEQEGKMDEIQMNESEKTEKLKKKKKRSALGRGLGSLLSPSLQTEGTRKIRFIEEEKSPQSYNVDKSFKGDVEQGSKQDFNESLKRDLDEDLSSRGLGRGAFLVKKVSIEQLLPNLNQPRKNFEAKSLDDLTASIKEKGVLQPILVRSLEPKEGERGSGEAYLQKFEIIAGERRWRASQKAGLFEVPVILKEASDQKSLEMALVENIQRENLNPLDEAKAYDYLMRKYSLSQDKLAKLLGKDRVTLTNVVRILKLPLKVQEAIRSSQVSIGLAKVLLSLRNEEQQILMLDKIIEEKWTVRELTRQVERVKRGEIFKKGENRMKDFRAETESFVLKLSEDLQKSLGSKVRVQYKAGRGKIAVYFYSDRELEFITSRLLDENHQ